MLKDRLNQLIEIATDDGYPSDIFSARKEYQRIAGDIYEDDKSYESRMALFLEWYILDRIIPDNDQTLLELIVEKNKENWPPNLLQIYKKFSDNIYGLFLVKKIKDDSVKILNLFDNNQYEVNETLGKLLFSKNGIFEGRLVSYNNMFYFTGSFCFHPEKANKFIKHEVRLVQEVQHRYKIESKSRINQLNAKKKMLYKISSKIDKLKSSLLEPYPEKRISKLKNDLADFEKKLSDVKKECSHLEHALTSFTHEKIFRGSKALQIHLIQKLSQMQLMWERSRQIDLNDIYKN